MSESTFGEFLGLSPEAINKVCDLCIVEDDPFIRLNLLAGVEFQFDDRILGYISTAYALGRRYEQRSRTVGFVVGPPEDLGLK